MRLSGAAVDASGGGGRAGGEILVGGDYQGANPTLANARITEVSAGSSLIADAGERGQGGKVVVWADDATRFAGTSRARGGAGGGDGGFVEVSGKQTLVFDGSVDTRGPLGATGTLLLDPSDITISTGANAAISAGPTFTGSAASSTLNMTTLQTALASNNVVVDTTSAFASAATSPSTTRSPGRAATRSSCGRTTTSPSPPGRRSTRTGNGALRLIANQDARGGGDVAINAALTAHAGGIAISGVNITARRRHADDHRPGQPGRRRRDGQRHRQRQPGRHGPDEGRRDVGRPPRHAGGTVTISGAGRTGMMTASGSDGDVDGGAGGAIQITLSAGTTAGASTPAAARRRAATWRAATPARSRSPTAAPATSSSGCRAARRGPATGTGAAGARAACR